MKSKQYPISFCIGIYNEASHIVKAISTIRENLDRYLGKNNYEIILVDNGSTDNTATIFKKIRDKNIKTYSIGNKGYGLALKKAIEEAKYEHIVLSAIDLPFGFSDLQKALPIWKNYDLLFGSKAHKKSIVYVPLQRKLSSYIYRFLIKILFGVPIRDTQGSIFAKRSKLLPILKYCDSSNAFFTAQLAIYGKLRRLQMIEIPVVMKKKAFRKSKYNIVKDGKVMLLSLISTYFVLHKEQVKLLKANES